MWEPLCFVSPGGISFAHVSFLATEWDKPGSRMQLRTTYLENTVRGRAVKKKT